MAGVARWPGRRGVASLAGAAALIAALAAADPGPAWAVCSLVGSTVTCSGTDTDGFDAGATNNLIVNVNSGAEVNTSAGGTQDAALDLGTGNAVNNSIGSGGKIASSDSGAPAIRAGQANINSSGTIEQASDAAAIVITGSGTSTIINFSGGLIDVSASSASDAIVGGGGGEFVFNFGEIKGDITLGGGNESVVLLDGSTMTGNVNLGDGTDNFALETGATFNGTADGGSGGSNVDTVFLSGAGADTIASSKLVGFEHLAKTGSGEWTLTGDIGFTGFVEIIQGVLSVASILTSPEVTVAFTGTLADTEKVVGNVFVGGIGGGTLAPGASIGTTTVEGNYTQLDDGTLEIEINATPANDLLAVTGDASLDGALDVVMAAGAYVGLSYEVVTVDGTMTGEFATVALSGPGAAGAPPFEVLYITDASGIVVLTFLIPPSEIFDAYVTAALGQARLFSDTVRWRLGELRRGAPPGRAAASRPVVLASAEPSPDMWAGAAPGTPAAVREGKLNLWARGVGALADKDGSKKHFGFDTATYGVVGGLDVQVADGVLLGVTGGASRSVIDWAGAEDGEAEAAHGGVYLSAFGEWAYLDLMAAYGWNAFDSERGIGAGDVARSDHDGRHWLGHAEVGVNLAAGSSWTVEPAAQVDYVHLEQDGFTETGAADPADNLTVKGRDDDSLRSRVRLRIAKAFGLGSSATLVAEVEGGWAHEFMDEDRVLVAGAGPAPVFASIAGDEPDRDSAVAGAGLTLFAGDVVSLFVRYAGEFSRNFTSHAAEAGLRLRF